MKTATFQRTINNIAHCLNFQAAHIGFFVLAFMLPVLAFAIPESNVEMSDGDNFDSKHTIWVVGDHKIVAQAFRACAAFFSSGGMWGIIKVATLFAFIAMTLAIITKRNFQAFNYIVMFVLMCCAFLIKTPVVVASYFGENGGNAIGAVKFEKVDGVPIGVAWPLTIFSNIAKTFTEKYDTEMQSIPSVGNGVSTQQQGGILIHGTEGFFSPLKSVLRLRSAAAYSGEDELIFKNLYNNMYYCNWNKKVSEFGDEVGAMKAISSRGQLGAVAYLFYITPEDLKAGKHNIQQKKSTCPAVGQYIVLNALLNVNNRRNQTHSPKAARLADSKIGTIKNIFTKSGTQQLQDEIDSLPNMIAASFSSGATINRNNFQRVEDIYQAMEAIINVNWGSDRYEVPQKYLQVTDSPNPYNIYQSQSLNDTMQQGLMDNRLAADEIEASIVYNHIISNCVTFSANDCNRYVLAMTNARNKAIVDTAGEASMFQHYMHYAMNILMFIYVVMTPVIVVVIFAMGLSGWRLVSAYLLFAVWINSWLPIDAAIAYYMQQSYLDRLADLTTALQATGKEYKIYSTGTLNAILDGAQDTIASAATFMSMVPIVMLSLLSGSIYGLVQVAQKAGMTGKDYVDETKTVADLEDSVAVGANYMLRQNQALMPTGNVSSQNLHRGELANNRTINDPVTLQFSEDRAAQANYEHRRQILQDEVERLENTTRYSNNDVAGLVAKYGNGYTHSGDGGTTYQNADTASDDNGIGSTGKVMAGTYGQAGFNGLVVKAGVNNGTSKEYSSQWGYTSNEASNITGQSSDTHQTSQSFSVDHNGAHTQSLTTDQARAQAASNARAELESFTQSHSHTTTSGINLSLDHKAFMAVNVMDPDGPLAWIKYGLNSGQIPAHCINAEFGEKLMHNTGDINQFMATMRDGLANAETQESALYVIERVFDGQEGFQTIANQARTARMELSAQDKMYSEQAFNSKFEHKLNAGQVFGGNKGEHFANNTATGIGENGIKGQVQNIINHAQGSITTGEDAVEQISNTEQSKAQKQVDKNKTKARDRFAIGVSREAIMVLPKSKNEKITPMSQEEIDELGPD